MTVVTRTTMTQAKQDTDSWRKRVDTKLNSLSKGHLELTARLDQYGDQLTKNTQLTKGIDGKIDLLIEKTALVVSVAEKVSFARTVINWLFESSKSMMTWVGQAGVAALTIFSVYWVWKSAAPMTKAFINIFNGNLP